MKNFLLLIFLLVSHYGITQEKHAYLLYDKNGQAVGYKSMADMALKNDIVLFGELHNNPISHWLQIELTKDIFNSIQERLILGAEMFETDNQLIINEYLGGLISYRNFKSEARLWNNFETDYKPLLDFAVNNKLSFIATNIPRRYASIVNNSGFEGLLELSDEAKIHIATLPIAYDPMLPGYQKMLSMMENMPGKQSNENFPKAQAIKDATMAYFITKNFKKDHIFLHFHGAFHSDYFDGIYWYLKKHNPSYKIMTISTVEQDDISALEEEHYGKADFIICVPSNMTKTY